MEATTDEEHPERPIAYLPPVAVWAVEEIASPPLAHPGDLWEFIGDAGGN